MVPPTEASLYRKRDNRTVEDFRPAFFRAADPEFNLFAQKCKSEQRLRNQTRYAQLTHNRSKLRIHIDKLRMIAYNRAIIQAFFVRREKSNASGRAT
jgi:hypothetical protein